MANGADILTYIKFSIYGLHIPLIVIYIISIIFIPRFHLRYNILTLNISFTILCCSLYWLLFTIIGKVDVKILFRDSTCGFLLYMQMLCICEGSYSIILITIHQLCDIVFYRKHFFQTNKWLTISMAIQWIIPFLVSIPSHMRVQRFCALPVWVAYYKVFMVIVVPAIVCVIIHIIIFKYIRLSTRRVQTQPQTSHTNTNTAQRPKVTRRDLHLLRHMIFIFAIYMSGWGPTNFIGVVNSYMQVNELITSSGSLLAQISAMIIILDLYIYNHELREYLRRKLLSFF